MESDSKSWIDRAAEEIEPDIGNPMDPGGRRSQARAAAIIRKHLASLSLGHERRDIERAIRISEEAAIGLDDHFCRILGISDREQARSGLRKYAIQLRDQLKDYPPAD